MDLKATKRIENICGIIVLACILVIASIEMNVIVKIILITLLAWGYCFAIFVNRDMKAEEALKELELK